METARSLSIFDERGGLSEPIMAFLDLFGVPYADLSIEGLVHDVLARWVTKGTERWQEPAVVLDDPDTRLRFWSLVSGPLPLYGLQLPTQIPNDYILVPGKTYRAADRTNAFLKKILGYGVTGSIAHLGGDREAGPKLDDRGLMLQTLPGGLPPLPGWTEEMVAALPWATEGDVLEGLWARSLDVPAITVRATRTVGHRANTSDTYRAWRSLVNPRPGSHILVVSMAPHTPFQYWDAVNALGQDFEIDICGPSAELGPQTPNYFTGVVGRWIRSEARAKGLVPQEV
jgi:hypothetical protein